MYEENCPNNCLLKKTKDIFINDIFREIFKKFKIKGQCVLIVDTRGSIFLNNFLTLEEKINEGIFSIEYIYRKRKPYKKYNAIYLISGNKNSIELVKEDFDIENNNKNQLYKFCHLFIIDEITQELLESMAHKKFLKYIKTLKQVSIEYVTLDKNTFSFGNDINYNSIYNLFNNNEEINNINILKLFNICKALNTYPNIIYFTPDKKCKFLAEKLNEKLKNNFTNKTKNGILLITSRYIDLTSPLKFSLIYSNLLLESFKNSKTNYCNEVKLGDNIFTLDYKDKLYNKYKDMNLNEVMILVDEENKAFYNSKIGQIFKNKDKDVALAYENFGIYKDSIRNISKHINLCHELQNIQSNRYILELLDLQKTIVSQKNEKGKKILDKDIIPLITKNKNKFNKNDFLRILCLIKYYYPKIDMEKIYSILYLYIIFSPEDKEIINFFTQEKFLVDLKLLEELDNSIISYREKNIYDSEEEKENKNDKRYYFIKESKLTSICDMCCKNKLPENLFTFVEKPENIKFQKNINNINLINDKEDEENLQNLILFNIGGLSNYEISSLERGKYLGQYNMNLILGSNKVYNYNEYFNEIKKYLKGKNEIIRKKEEEFKDIDENNEKERDIKIKINDISLKKNDLDSKEKFNIKNDVNTNDSFPIDYK